MFVHSLPMPMRALVGLVVVVTLTVGLALNSLPREEVPGALQAQTEAPGSLQTLIEAPGSLQARTEAPDSPVEPGASPARVEAPHSPAVGASGPQAPPALVAEHRLPARVTAADTDGKLAAVGTDGEVRVFRLADGKPVGPVLASPGTVRVQFSHNGQFLFACGPQGAWIVRPTDGSPVYSLREPVLTGAMSPDGGFVAVARAREDGCEVTYTDLAGSVVFKRLFKGRATSRLELSPAGRYLLIFWPEQGSFFLFQMPRGKLLAEGGGEAAFSPDGSHMAQHFRGRLRVVDLDRSSGVGPVNSGHSGPVEFSADNGSRVLSWGFLASGESIAQAWNAADLKPLGRFTQAQAGGSAFLRDPRLAVSWETSGRVVVWDVASGRGRVEAFPAAQQVVRAVGGGDRLAAAGQEGGSGILRIWKF